MYQHWQPQMSMEMIIHETESAELQKLQNLFAWHGCAKQRFFFFQMEKLLSSDSSSRSRWTKALRLWGVSGALPGLLGLPQLPGLLGETGRPPPTKPEKSGGNKKNVRDHLDTDHAMNSSNVLKNKNVIFLVVVKMRKYIAPVHQIPCSILSLCSHSSF